MNHPSNEHELLSDLQKILIEHSDSYDLEIGDDAAVRKSSDSHRLIFTSDLSVENVHFKREWMSYHEIGYKAMVTNISDCASMGAIPESALIQLIFPENEESLKNSIFKLYEGFNEACREWHFPIIGGDLSKGAQWAIGITLIGKIPKDKRFMSRKGAQTGDKLWITGFPGKSAAGLDALYKWGRNDVPPQYAEFINAHIRPQPQVELGLFFRDCNEVHAMMDLSDGLTKDCRTLAFENNLGIVLDLDSSLFPKRMIELSGHLQKQPLDWVIKGGEEYELLFAAAPSFQPSLQYSAKCGNCVCIGEFTYNYQGLYLKKQTEIVEILGGGWDHL